MGLFDDENDSRRTLSIRDKQIVYVNAHHKCENCGKRIYFEEMEIGHKTAWSRGGGTTIKNSVCLCATCNRLQGTDSWATFQKKQGKVDTSIDNTKSIELNRLLKSLKKKQLKELCDDLGVKRPQSRDIGTFVTEMQSPSKSEYIRKIIKSNVDTEKIKGQISKYR